MVASFCWGSLRTGSARVPAVIFCWVRCPFWKCWVALGQCELAVPRLKLRPLWVSRQRKTDDMTIGNLAFRADSAQSTRFESLERRTVASYERVLRCTENRLQESLAREQALLRQMDELIQQQDALSKLFAHREDAANRIAGLTARQRQIMELVLAGHPSKNIAADLGISQRTVENHRASIKKKTGSRSLPALARLALAAAWNRADEPLVQRVSSHGSTANSQEIIFTPAGAASSVGILHPRHYASLKKGIERARSRGSGVSG